jgi:hypothetical protein
MAQEVAQRNQLPITRFHESGVCGMCVSFCEPGGKERGGEGRILTPPKLGFAIPCGKKPSKTAPSKAFRVFEYPVS